MWEQGAGHRETPHVGGNGLLALNHHLFFTGRERTRIDDVRGPSVLLIETQPVKIARAKRAVGADVLACDGNATGDGDAARNGNAAGNRDPACDGDATGNRDPVPADV